MKTFTLSDKQCARAKPGQFLMLWIPGVDEIPLSIMAASAGKVSVTVKAVGEATRALHALGTDAYVGVRGPFGTCFRLDGSSAVLVGGGTGVAPLRFLAQCMAEKAVDAKIIVGAKTRGELLFVDALRSLVGGGNVVAVTEDGSYGVKGLATDQLEMMLQSGSRLSVYACGPELMVHRAFELAEAYGCQFEASLERLMRCGIGLCGSCVIGKYRVCADGPVFTGDQLREIAAEFGHFKRGFKGEKVPV